MTGSGRHVWTREGTIELNPVFSSLGVGEERRTNLIDQYAGKQESELRDVMRDVYVRAYRRAGLLSGDPDEICSVLPARNPLQDGVEPVRSHSPSGFVESPPNPDGLPDSDGSHVEGNPDE